MTAPERVSSFLLELSERRDTPHAVEVPMSRMDIADYLGLTIETVCRILSSFKRDGMIGIPAPHRIELRDREGLMALCDARPQWTPFSIDRGRAVAGNSAWDQV